MTEYTILAIHPTKGMTKQTVTAKTSEEAIATLEPGCVVLTVSTTTAI